VLAIYCRHNRAAAHALIAAGRALEWTVRTPISAAVFAQQCKSLGWPCSALRSRDSMFLNVCT
jgi:hypothetical protein